MRRVDCGARLRRAALTLPLLAPLLLVGAPAALASSVAATAPERGDVQVRIDDVTPSVAPRSTARLPLQIRVTLTNRSGQPLTGVRVQGVRGEPIGDQRALDDSIADTTPPTDGIDIPTARPLEVDLPTSAPVTTTFVSNISILNTGGLCQCANSVYPVHLIASADDDGSSVVLGTSTTYIPSQVDPVTPVKVSWVWPLLDRPHRFDDETVFTDDELASSVAGGRLDRALQVIEGLKATTPVTLLTDPELIDELAVMAEGSYTVRAANGGTPTPGTGQAVAQAWLTRLAAVLSPDRAVQVSLTPYADPDIQSLARDNLTWDTEPPKQMQQRVTAALLGRTLATDVAWPAGGTVGRKALDAMAASGVRTVVLDGSALSPSTTDGIPVAVARLRSNGNSVTAAATSPAMQRQVAQAVETDAPSTTGASPLSYLIAEIAVRAVQTGDGPSQAVLTPTRYVDPSPERAIRTIEDTSSSAFATPTAIRSLTAERPSRVSSLRTNTPATDTTSLPVVNLDAARYTLSSQPRMDSLLSRDADGQQFVIGLTRAAQRITSSAWRPTSASPMDTAMGPRLARELDSDVSTLLRGVRIITPSSGSYTLGSKDSALPITVENTLSYTVVIDLDVRSLDRVPGYSTPRDIGPQRIAANAKQTVQVPSKLDRSGRIPVQAQLETPTGDKLGDAVTLYVRSTVFGTIGIVITLVAGGVLALALIVRLIRRLQRLRRKADREAGESAEPADAGSDDRVGTVTT